MYLCINYLPFISNLMQDIFVSPTHDPDLLARAVNCWSASALYRAERTRCKLFTYGDQWSDIIEYGGVRITERELIHSQGNIPLKNNLIRRLVRNVLGVFRNRWETPEFAPRDSADLADAPALRKLLRASIANNRMQELYSRSMEEFLVGGLVVHKKWFGRRGRRTDCYTDFVQPDNFFFDTNARDPRGGDEAIVGEIIDLDFATLAATFCSSPAERDRIAEIYGKPGPNDLCRIWEIWNIVYRPQYVCHDKLRGSVFVVPEDEYHPNPDVEARWEMAEVWQYSFIAPDGAILRRGFSPYAHGGHPYVFKAYPFVDGEIHSFVSDIIDQQKVTNRLISMYDWILRASAKGVLLFPEGALPDGVDIRDVAEEWSRFNGVILFKPRTGVPLPQQISSKATDIGITELLEIQMKMMEDISGVNGALQGKLDSTSMSGTLYNQQTQNSLTALTDLMQTFDDFIAQATLIDASNLRQFKLPPHCRRELRSAPDLI